MRVALLTREYPPEVYGGAGVHLDELSRVLARIVDVRVHCFGGPRPSPLVARTYEPWEALAGEQPHLAALRCMSVDLAMAAGVEGADLAHSHTWYANLAGHLAKLLYGIPHVATTHSLEPLRPWKAEQLGGGYALSSFCERIGLESADAIIAVSEGMRSDVLRCYPAVAADRVNVIHNGVDPETFSPDEGTDVLEAHGIDPTRPSVVFVGRITRQKGIIHLLEAAPNLNPEAQLVLCASTPDTAEIEQEVSARIDQLEGVRWLRETLPRPDLAQILSHASVFVCPSVYEPFGMVNLEAMACQAPVVATAVGGIPEIVVDGETGYLVPPGDPGALAERINLLLADRALQRRFGKAGRARVLACFSWTTVAERTAALYDRLCSD
ncbi:MAG: glycogen synthase [Egibacteraceae bacterium]